MALLSGQITVTTAGTAVQGPTTVAGRKFAFAAHPGNTGVVYVGNDGADDVSATTGFPLLSTATLSGHFVMVDTGHFGQRTLGQFWFDAANSGDKVCWLVVD